MSAIISLGNTNFESSKIYKVETMEINKGNLDQGGFLKRVDGTRNGFSGFTMTEKISIPEGYQFVSAYLSGYQRIDPTAGTTPFAFVCFYDSSMNFISSKSNLDIVLEAIPVATTDPIAYNVARGYASAVIPDNAAYVAFSWYNGKDASSPTIMAAPVASPDYMVELFFSKRS